MTGISAGAIAAANYALDPNARSLVRKGIRLLLRCLSEGGDLEYYLRLTEQNEGPAGSFWDAMRGVMTVRSLLKSPSLVQHHRHMALISELVPEGRIEDTRIPFGVVALDLITGNIVCLREGDLRLAVAASTAIPGIFPPVNWPPYRLVDAGLVVPIPIDAARQWSSDPVVAVDITSSFVPSEPTDSGVTLLLRMQQSQMHTNRESVLRNADLILRPVVDSVKLPLTRAIIKKSIAAGEKSVAESAPELWRLFLSNKDSIALEVVTRHQLLSPEAMSDVITRAVRGPGGSFLAALETHLSAGMLAMLRELVELTARTRFASSAPSDTRKRGGA